MKGNENNPTGGNEETFCYENNNIEQKYSIQQCNIFNPLNGAQFHHDDRVSIF